MSFKDLVVRSRSYRRFHEEMPVTAETLRELVDLARLGPSAANLQPLRYLCVSGPEMRAKVFPLVAWAGYLKDWDGPAPGERPAAYIIVLGDKAVITSFGVDPGIAAQTICLGAAMKGLGGCMMGAIQRKELRALFDISTQYEILLVIALGYPNEQVVLEPLGPDGDIKYWRDAEGVHHVPKRPLDAVLLGEY